MKKALVILSGLILLLGILSVTVMASESNDAASEETDESGTCGENINWTLTGSDSDLTLTLSGNGEMGDYSESSVPWASEKSKNQDGYCWRRDCFDR